jgi:hypothetical protein
MRVRAKRSGASAPWLWHHDRRLLVEVDVLDALAGRMPVSWRSTRKASTSSRRTAGDG